MSTSTVRVRAQTSAGIDDGRTFALPRIREGLAAVRHCVAAALAEWQTAPAAREDVLLVVSELTTNAIIHALPPATLSLFRTQVNGTPGIRVEVVDNGPVDTDPADDGPCEERGRGRLIVQALAARFEQFESRGRTICRADVLL
jgi:anti-sigma regulatory factor (Ser/Thr protein kinase)